MEPTTSWSLIGFVSAEPQRELLFFGGGGAEETERNLECRVLRSQSEKGTASNLIRTIRLSGKGKTMKTIKRSVVAGLGVEVGEIKWRTFRAVQIFFMIL